MKLMLTSAAALVLCTQTATAGGVERSNQNVAILFQKGSYAEFTYGFVRPEISGTQALTLSPTSPAGAQSGNIAEAYGLVGFGYKQSFGDRFEFAIVKDTPVGAHIDYAPLTGYVYGGTIGSRADLESTGINLLGRYKFNDNFSVIGGARVVRTQGEVDLFSGYSLRTSASTDLGYVVGVAYEKPEIALRVALTYNSAIDQKFDSVETSARAGLTNVPGQFTTTIPQSWNLEFQSGVAKDTLVFGSVRWVNWSKYDISPTLFTAADGNGFGLVELKNDVTTYNIGIGRRFNETWAGAITAGYEKSGGGFSGNLNPTDGNRSIGLAATYTKDKMTVTGGISHIWIGGTSTELPSPPPAPPRTSSNTTLARFSGNSAVAIGLKVGYNF